LNNYAKFVVSTLILSQIHICKILQNSKKEAFFSLEKGFRLSIKRLKCAAL